MNMNEPPSLLRNDYAGRNGWIEVKLEGTRSNRAGLGATVRRHGRRAHDRRAPCSASRATTRTTTCALHFGLGAARAARTRSRCAGRAAQVDVLRDVEGRRVVTVREGERPSLAQRP